MTATGNALEGKRILVTRPKKQASALSAKVEELGGIPIEIPLIKIVSPENEKDIKKAVENLFTYDWIVFTSVNGVQYFFDYLEKYDKKLIESNRPKIAVVGMKTLEALAQKGLSADIIPDQYVAENLIENMLEHVNVGDSVLLARGNLARSLLPEKLSEKGIIVADIVFYETVVNLENQTELYELLKNKSLDMITFTSSSTVTNFVELLEGTNWRELALLNGIQIACIGPITEKTAVAAGIIPSIVAKEYTIAGLVDAIVSLNT